VTDVASSEHAVAHGDGTIVPSDQALIEELFGPQQSRKGALKRGFKTMPRILPYLRPYRKFAIATLVLTVLLAAVALAEPWPLAFVVDSIIGNDPAPGWVTGIFGSSVGGLIALAVVATLFLTLLSGAMTVVNEYLSTTVDQRMVLDFRTDMFEHAQKLSLAFHDTESKGILMYRINDQAVAMGQIVTAIPAVAQSLLTLIGMAYISVMINPLLALLALAITPFIIYSTTFYTDRIEPRLYRVRGLGAINLAIVYEAMAMMRVVLAFGTQRREYMRFRRQGETWVDETIGLTVRQTLFRLVVQMITAAGTAAVIGVGAYQAVQGEITAGELLVILSYISQIYQPLENLTITIANFQQWFINMLMAFDLMDMEPEVKEKPDARPLDRARGEIELEGVEFGYTGRPGVLKDISFRIPSGRAVAIVGPTGAGKSTLVSLLPRFYDPKQGSVRIEGHDVRDLKIADVRKQFSVVLQEPLLFSGTIEENIRYAKSDASMEEVVEAAKAANVHDFISELPDGYGTVIGERGAKISGGERQRIAVARAFLRDAPILILDEPTSSIDSRTEEVILDALGRLMEGRTTILIAHRLSTIRSVNEILVMDHGEIVQQGTHEELVAQPGLYRQLWTAQTRAAGGDPKPLQAPGPSEHRADEGEPRTSPPVPEVSELAPAIDAEPRPSPVEGGPFPSLPRPKIVLLGMLTKIPVGGVAWLVGQYAVGLERLGYEVYYVEAHARTPSMFPTGNGDDAADKAARYIADIAARFGLGARWAFQALHDNGRCYGMSAEQLDRLYADAALIINMHGGTLPLPEHAATDRLVFMGTDPVVLELEVHRGDHRAIQFLEQHVAFFTWGLNFGNPDCRLPWARPFDFVPSPPPVVLDFWDNDVAPDGAPFTTIGNWRQQYRNVEFDGRIYRWSKHQQFQKFLNLPFRAGTPLELALSSYEPRDRLLLAEHGWRVRPGFEFSRHPDSYRDYIIESAGEFSVAKEQNVHFRTGWFSERSATYLAAGRPVILQDTGFGAALPTGEGLFAFAELDDAAEALEAVRADPERHRRAARELAREHLSHEVVLGDMLGHVGLRGDMRGRAPRRPPPADFPRDLSLDVHTQRPFELAKETAEHVCGRPVPALAARIAAPDASVLVPVVDDLVCARLALESVLANTPAPYEVLVIDRGSGDPLREYLEVLAARNRHVRLIREDDYVSDGPAWNRGIEASVADRVVLLQGDAIVPPGWLAALSRRLEDPELGIVGSVTNRLGGDAEVPVSYTTYEEMLRFASERAKMWHGRPAVDIELAEMCCAAIRRDVLKTVGQFDESAGGGAFEDYARRVREAGFRVVYVEELFVHRFGDGVNPDVGPRIGPTAVSGTGGRRDEPPEPADAAVEEGRIA
jgi:ATP-binding cassette, subfamily B, bacterial